MKNILVVSRYLVGGLFIFSGLIKVNDPVGTQVKLEEYFTIFSYDIAPFFSSLIPLSLFLSFFLSIAEVVLGLALLVRYRSKWIVTSLLLLIVFFTFLTFYSAYFNKVTDCGCFGDVIKLTPWQSFLKDVILLVLILLLFFNRKHLVYRGNDRFKAFLLSGTVVTCLVVALLAVAHLPLFDFRAYKVGTHIPTDMLPPADDPYQIPKIQSFAIWGDEADVTEEVLQGRKLLVIIHDTETTDLDAYGELTALVNEVESSINTLAVTASSGAEFELLRHEVQLAAPYYYADKTVLKTMIRSNPGLMLLRDGEVLGKWHHNDTPSAEDILDKFR